MKRVDHIKEQEQDDSQSLQPLQPLEPLFPNLAQSPPDTSPSQPESQMIQGYTPAQAQPESQMILGYSPAQAQPESQMLQGFLSAQSQPESQMVHGFLPAQSQPECQMVRAFLPAQSQPERQMVHGYFPAQGPSGGINRGIRAQQAASGIQAGLFWNQLGVMPQGFGTSSNHGNNLLPFPQATQGFSQSQARNQPPLIAPAPAPAAPQALTDPNRRAPEFQSDLDQLSAGRGDSSGRGRGRGRGRGKGCSRGGSRANTSTGKQQRAHSNGKGAKKQKKATLTEEQETFLIDFWESRYNLWCTNRKQFCEKAAESLNEHYFDKEQDTQKIEADYIGSHLKAVLAQYKKIVDKCASSGYGIMDESADNLSDHLDRKLPNFRRLHRFLATKNNVAPGYIVQTGIGNAGETVVKAKVSSAGVSATPKAVQVERATEEVEVLELVDDDDEIQIATIEKGRPARKVTGVSPAQAQGKSYTHGVTRRSSRIEYPGLDDESDDGNNPPKASVQISDSEDDLHPELKVELMKKSKSASGSTGVDIGSKGRTASRDPRPQSKTDKGRTPAPSRKKEGTTGATEEVQALKIASASNDNHKSGAQVTNPSGAGSSRAVGKARGNYADNLAQHLQLFVSTHEDHAVATSKYMEEEKQNNKKLAEAREKQVELMRAEQDDRIRQRNEEFQLQQKVQMQQLADKRAREEREHFLKVKQAKIDNLKEHVKLLNEMGMTTDAKETMKEIRSLINELQ